MLLIATGGLSHNAYALSAEIIVHLFEPRRPLHGSYDMFDCIKPTAYAIRQLRSPV